MMMRWLSMILLCEVSHAFYNEDSDVILLTSDTFSQVTNSSDFYMVEFYAPWCQQCQNLAPEYEQAATSVKEYAHFAAVDATEYPDLAKQFNVNGFPTILIFNEPPSLNPYTHKMYRTSLPFNGSPDRRTFKKFTQEHLPSLVLLETSLVGFTKMEKGSSLPIVVLVSKSEKITPRFKSLSVRFSTLSFIQIPTLDDDDSVQETFEVDTVPSLVVRLPDGTNRHYLGNLLSTKDIDVFLQEFIIQEEKEKKEVITKEETWITPQVFQQQLPSSTQVYLVAFAKKDDDNLSLDLHGKSWKKALSLHDKWGPVVDVSAVDCTAEGDDVVVCPNKLPTLALYPRENDKKNDGVPVFFPYSEEGLKEALEAVEASVPDHVTIIRSHSEIEMVLMKAKNTHKMPMLLLTTKNTTPTMIRALQEKYTTEVLWAIFPSPDAAAMKQLQVQRLPAILAMFEQPGKENEPAAFAVMSYNKQQVGPFSFTNIARFIDTLYPTAFPEKGTGQKTMNPVDAVQDGPRPILSSADDFQKECLSRGSTLCAMVFLTSKEASYEIIDAIEEQTKSARDPYRFMIVDGGCYPKLALAFDVHSLPTLVVFSPSKNRFATYVGAWDATHGRSFLRGVLTGTIPTAALPPGRDLQQDSVWKKECRNDTEELVQDNDDDDDDIEDLMKSIREDEEKEKIEMKRQLAQELKEREAVEAAAEEDAKKMKKKKKKKKGKKKKKKQKKHDEL